MNRKTLRAFSMLLAVLMVLVTIPVVSLSATSALPVAEEPIEVWDGYVPTDANGVTATVEDWVFGTGTAAGATLTYTDWTSISAHITVSGSTITVKTAGGLAILCALSNIPTTIGTDVVTDHATRMAFFKGKTVVLEKDIYLNDPTKAELTNDFMPLFWCGLDPLEARGGENVGGSTFNFDGQGHFIYGWQVNQTITYDKTNYLNNAWGFIGHYPAEQGVVKNLALLNQKIELNATIMSLASTLLDTDDTIEDVVDTTSSSRGGITTACVGSVIGHTPYTQPYNGTTVYFTVENCIVNSDTHCTINGNGTYNDGGVNGRNYCGGGVIGGGPSGLRFYDASGTEQSGRDCCGRRSVKNVIISAQVILDGSPVASTAAIATDGWNSTMLYENVLVLSWAQQDLLTSTLSPYAPLTAYANNKIDQTYYGSCFGGVTTHTVADGVRENWFSTADTRTYHNTFKMGVTFEDLYARAEETLSVSLGEGLKNSYEGWNFNDDTGLLPMPATFTAEGTKRIIHNALADTLAISTPNDMLTWRNNADQYARVELQNDIDMAGVTWVPIDAWGGTFDGNGYTVSNLTADCVNNTPAPDDSLNWNDYRNARGGLVNAPLNGCTVRNVCFDNMVVTAKGMWKQVHAGMLFGMGSNSATPAGSVFTVENVVIIGKGNDIATSEAGTYYLSFGYVAGCLNKQVTMNIENFVFVCTDPTTRYESGFVSNNSTNGTVSLKNAYAVGVGDESTYAGFAALEATYQKYDNVYVAGPLDRAYGYSADKTVARYYKDTAKGTAYTDAVGALMVANMVGTANPMALPTEAFTLYANRLPIPTAILNNEAIAEKATNAATNGATFVSTWEDLDAYAQAYNAGNRTDMILLNDIVYNAVMDVESGKAGLHNFVGLKDFQNTIYGNGHTIYGLYQEVTMTNDTGIARLGFIQNAIGDATIQDLALRGGSHNLLLAEGADATLIFGKSTDYRGAPASVGALIGEMAKENKWPDFTVTIKNVYIDNAVNANFGAVETALPMTSGGVYYLGLAAGGFVGNVGCRAVLVAENVQYNGQISYDLQSAADCGITADIGGFYGGQWLSRAITINNAFFNSAFVQLGDQTAHTAGVGGRTMLPGLASYYDSEHSWWAPRDDFSHNVNGFTTVASTVSGGLHKYTNVYTTNRVETVGGENRSSCNYAYTIEKDTTGEHELTGSYFKVDDNATYTNTDDCHYYAVTYQVDPYLITADNCNLTGFTFASGSFPVLAIFANEAEDLAQTEEVLGNAAQYLQYLGASIRLANTANKQGIRFSYVVNQNAFHATENGYKVVYGSLLIPTAILNGAELTLDTADALRFVSEGTDGAMVKVLDALGYDDANSYGDRWNVAWATDDCKAFHVALVNFEGLTTASGAGALTISFTARAYVQIFDSEDNLVTTVYGDATACSPVDIAKAFLAQEGNDPAQEAKVEAMFGDLLN